MSLEVAPRWLAGGQALDARVLPLLREVARTGSLNQAVSTLRMSYRNAWGLLGITERTLGQTLVMMERGRGARLSSFAEQLLAADAAAASLLDRDLGPTLHALNREGPARNARSPKPLLIHASHDIALAELKDMLSRSGGTLELHFRGSLDCLASLARRECDMAGFHVPETAGDDGAMAPYRPWLRARNLRLIRFVDRRQGLMVAHDNPKRLQSLADLAASGARFVNRQPESGTRLCFDRLLAAASLRPAQIAGYEIEEFTHAAVAATVASGMADAGFGIEAAARRGGLDFLPLATERYFLAARPATLARPAAQALLATLRSSAYQDRVRALPGYGAAGMGLIVSPREALAGG